MVINAITVSLSITYVTGCNAPRDAPAHRAPRTHSILATAREAEAEATLSRRPELAPAGCGHTGAQELKVPTKFRGTQYSEKAPRLFF